jgi:hypothetical protein
MPGPDKYFALIEVKVKLSLCLIKLHAMKMYVYGGKKDTSTHSYSRH